MSKEKPDQPRYAAGRSFGPVGIVKETDWKQWAAICLEDFIQDVRYGARLLRLNPGFTVVAVLTLAIGIGANTAIFSAANAMLFRPLPFPEPGRLVAISETDPQANVVSSSAADFATWRAQGRSVESIAFMVDTRHLSLVEAGEPISVVAQAVSANYFDTLGVHPAWGRNFLPGEDSQGKNNVAMLSYGFWVREFGGRPDALNRTIELNGGPVTIVGIMPQSFSFGADAVDMWVPVVLNPLNHAARYIGLVVGRLAPDATIAQAQSEMTIIAGRLATQFPNTNKGYGIEVRSLLEKYVGDVRPLLFALLGAVGSLLLICCVNIANLLLARTLARQREIVIRSALGARRGRIVRQFLAESLILAALGGAFGFVLSHWGLRLLVMFAPAMPRLSASSIDGWALGFTAALTLLTGLAFGLLPALQATRLNLTDALKSGGRGLTKGGQRARGLLVVSEIALALILLVGAGLFIRSLIRLQRVDPGFQPSNAFAAKVVLPRAKYSTTTQIAAFADRTVAALSALPQVYAVGATVWMPLSDGASNQFFTLTGWPITDPTELPHASVTSVTPGYGRAMGIPLLRGRFFNGHDAQDSTSVALVNEAMARRYFRGIDPIGQRIGIMAGGTQPDHWDEIVGVVGNAKVFTLKDDENQPELYEALGQRTQWTLTFVVRTQGYPIGLPAEIRAAIQSVDRTQPIASMDPLPELISRSFSSLNFTVFLFGAFSIVALGLATLGVYGVMAYFVTQRTNEIGVRMALGARPENILRLVFGQAGRFIGLGVVAGLAGALALSQFLQSMLFGVSAHDPVTFVGVAALLALVAVAASLLPALRAMQIDPVVALRCE